MKKCVLLILFFSAKNLHAQFNNELKITDVVKPYFNRKLNTDTFSYKMPNSLDRDNTIFKMLASSKRGFNTYKSPKDNMLIVTPDSTFTSKMPNSIAILKDKSMGNTSRYDSLFKK